MLKTFLLNDIKNTIESIDFNNFKQNNNLTNKLLFDINLNESNFSNIINWCMKYLNSTSYKFNHLTLRMSCLD